MTIQPTLVLDENDLKPFVEEFRKVMKVKEDAVFIFSSIIPVALGNGKWSVELKGEFVNPAPKE